MRVHFGPGRHGRRVPGVRTGSTQRVALAFFVFIVNVHVFLLVLFLDEQARDATERDGAALVSQGELPEDLHPLKRLHADAVRHVDLDGDE